MIYPGWKKTAVKDHGTGEKTITYENDKIPGVKIESRTRNIPHSNREGTWSHTEYVELESGRVFWSLKDAIEYAETRLPVESTQLLEELAAVDVW